MKYPKCDVFVSYRRERDAQTARLIRSELQRRGYRVFLDVDDLRLGGHFDETLLERIREAPNFIVILSVGCLDRCSDPEDWLRREIACAFNNGKRVVPIVMPGFSFPSAESLPEEIRSLRVHHGVKYSHEFFDAMMKKIVDYLGTPDAAGRNPQAIARVLAGAAKAMFPSPSKRVRTKAVTAPVAKPVPTERKVHKLWFWLGLLLLTVGLGLLGSIFHLGGASPGGTFHLPPFILWMSLLFIPVGIPLLILSRRGMMHRWFWVGDLLFAVGAAEIPAWVSIWAYKDGFPKAPHDLGFLALSIGVFSMPLVIVGAFCLWKGWPRDNVKHRRAQLGGFISAICVLSVGVSFVCGFWANHWSTRTQQILAFTEDFESGKAKSWELDSGWNVVLDNGNHVLDGQGTDYRWARPSVTSASAYILEADFKLFGGSLRFNVLNSAPNDRYSVEVSVSGIGLFRESSEGWAALDRTEVDIPVNLWHHVKIAAGRQIVSVWLDQQLKIYRWDEERLSSGKFAIETCENSHASVDNIVVGPNTFPAPQDVDILSFVDDFQDGVANGWRLQPGWLVVSDKGNYVLDGQGHVDSPQGEDYRWARPLATSETDYRFEADFALLSGTMFEFNVRYSSASRYILWVDSGHITLGKQYGQSSAVNLDTAEVDIGFHRWHTVEILLNVSTIQVYIDDTLRIEASDPSPLAAGSFAIICNPDSHVQVDNIHVNSVE